MILYHGSYTEFDKFQIQGEGKSRHYEYSLKEGYGIYMIEDIDFAKSYGPYLYVVECSNYDIIDFTNSKEIYGLLRSLIQKTNIPLDKYMDFVHIADCLISGDYSCTCLIDEIILMLDSDESFYFKYQELIDADLFDKIREEFNKLIKPIVKYYDKSFDKNVYICIKEESKVLNILCLEKF